MTDGMHPQDRKNLIIFFALALLVFVLFDMFIQQPKMEEAAKKAGQEQAIPKPDEHLLTTPESGQVDKIAVKDRNTALSEAKRVKIDNGRVTGSVALTGGRIDDLTLSDYYETLAKERNINLLSPAGTQNAHYAEFGWVPADKGIKTPDGDTRWRVKRAPAGDVLAADMPLVLTWNNGQGLVFEKEIAIDQDYMFRVTQRIINQGDRDVTVYPYGLVSRHGVPPDTQSTLVLHDGPVGYMNDELQQIDFWDMRDFAGGEQSHSSENGWIGIGQKYWLVGLVPDQGQRTKFRFVYTGHGDNERFQVDVMGSAKIVKKGASAEATQHLFAGAKKVLLLDQYEEQLNVPHFDLAVDFGVFYFLTKPFFYILHWLFGLAGNFGVAILLFTILIRLAVFPLANKSFVSFAKMKELSPKMVELREKYGDDRMKLQQELVKLYQEEKINPMSGCWPILVQIPIFFALYKVLLVTIEMRHAPFFGWVQDLSAMDPTTVFNLFGLLPYDVPSILMIGALPCMMCITMILQKKMNPPPQDPIQAKMLAFMPYFFTLILAKFAAGLVVYWTWNNMLSMLQQYVIMRRLGVEVHLFKRSKTEEKLEDMVEKGPDVHPGLEIAAEDIEDAMDGEEPKDIKKIKPPKPKKKKKKKK